MTKITPDNITPNQNGLNKAAASARSGAKTSETSVQSTGLPSDFSQVLWAELESLGSDVASTVSSDGGGLPELEATFSAQISQIRQAEQTPETVVDVPGRAAAILDRLDAYAQGLGDSSTSLRKAHGLLDEIDLDLQELIPHSATDPQLKKIVDHMASLVAVEKIKLNRGDYL